jgi:hypothetical protein
MTAGHVGNRHPRLGGFGHGSELLLHRVTPASLDPGEDLNSICCIRHSRITRRTPSPSLCSYVRLKWGPFHNATRSSLPAASLIPIFAVARLLDDRD